jgi:hypothetical protein
MDVHNQDRLVRLAWLGEGVQIREVQAGVSVRETEIGTGIMVRHGSFTPLSCSSAHECGAKRLALKPDLSNACGLVHLSTLKDESYKVACVE